MPLTPQQRSMAILGGVFGGGLLITFLLVSLVSGGDDKRDVSIGPDRTSTSSSSTSSSTLPPTTITTLPVTNPTIPITQGTTATTVFVPGTVKIVTTTAPKPPPTTAPKPTTTTTKPKTKAQQLEEELEAALFGGPPPDGTPSRVRVVIRESDGQVVVTWKLDDSLSSDDQKYQARYDATNMLKVIQGFTGVEDDDVIIRGTISDPLPALPNHRKRVVRLVYERPTLDGIDFTTFDPLTVFDSPPADDADIDDSLNPTPTATTSTTTSTTSP
jgi:hypothetical protein